MFGVYLLFSKGECDFSMADTDFEDMNMQLVDAVDEDDIEKAKCLLEKGASVDARRLVFISRSSLINYAREVPMSFTLNVALDCSDVSVWE